MDTNFKLELEQAVTGQITTEDAGSLAAAYVTGVGVAALIAAAQRVYDKIYGQANRACGGLKGKEGRLCRKNYRITAAKAQIQSLKYARSKCGKTNDPKACVRRLNEKIRKLQDKYPDIEYAGKAVAKHAA